jgi:serine/threonine-protein kinase RsbW/stage II sporulation protein AB (anti-sigma F factor)
VTVANGERDAQKNSLQLTLPAEPDSVGKARHAVSDFARAHGADPGDVALAVSEAVSNAVVHGFRDRDPGRVDIRALVEGDRVVVSVSDDGVGVTPNPQSPGLGLGLALIGSLADGVELRRNGRPSGTTLIMRFPRED